MILIAIDDRDELPMRDFNDLCADEVIFMCKKCKTKYEKITNVSLNYETVTSKMKDKNALFIAAEGNEYGIFAGEDNRDVISVNTNNKSLAGKLFYAISCLTAKKLKDKLIENGLVCYWGYECEFKFKPGFRHFLDCALNGIKCLLDGKSAKESYIASLATYDNCLKTLEKEKKEKKDTKLIAAYDLAIMALINDREGLIVEGDLNFKI
jgi:hypothetical protein